jgi:parallel beta-helix repeat protein
VVFTSYRDDSVGGDTNGDGLSSGSPGAWYWLYLTASTPALLTDLSHVEVRYGGSSGLGALLVYSDVVLDAVTVRDSSSSGVYNQSSSFEMTNCVVRGSGQDGFRLHNTGSPLIEGCEISDNAQSGIRVMDGNSSPRIVDNEITGSGDWGIRYESGSSGSPPISGNTIRGNRLLAILPPVTLPQPGDGNVLGPNSRNALWVRGTSVDRTTDLRLSVLSSEAGVPEEEAYELRTYVVSGSLEMAPGTVLTVDPGVVVKFSGVSSEIQIDGTLSSVGTAGEPVDFTSYRDDAYGGDTNADGTSSAASPGDWRYLHFPRE